MEAEQPERDVGVASGSNRSGKDKTRQEVGVRRRAQVSSRLFSRNSTPEWQEWAQVTVYFRSPAPSCPPPTGCLLRTEGN